MTSEERELIRRGLARVHKGRLIPRIRGGATYTPKELIKAKSMGNGSGAITTWQYQNTGTLGAVCRSMIFSGQAGATGAVSVEIGVTGATAIQAQRIIDTVPLVASTPYPINGWYTIDVNDFLSGFANSATVTAGAYGVLAS